MITQFHNPVDAILAFDLASGDDRLILADILEIEFGLSADGLRRGSKHDDWFVSRMYYSHLQMIEEWMPEEAKKTLGPVLENAFTIMPELENGSIVSTNHTRTPVGFYSRARSNKGYDELLYVYVRPDWRRKGACHAMMNDLYERMCTSYMPAGGALIRVPESNVGAICALIRCGFTVIDRAFSKVALMLKVEK